MLSLVYFGEQHKHVSIVGVTTHTRLNCGMCNQSPKEETQDTRNDKIVIRSLTEVFSLVITHIGARPNSYGLSCTKTENLCYNTPCMAILSGHSRKAWLFWRSCVKPSFLCTSHCQAASHFFSQFVLNCTPSHMECSLVVTDLSYKNNHMYINIDITENVKIVKEIYVRLQYQIICKN